MNSVTKIAETDSSAQVVSSDESGRPLSVDQNTAPEHIHSFEQFKLSFLHKDPITKRIRKKTLPLIKLEQVRSALKKASAEEQKKTAESIIIPQTIKTILTQNRNLEEPLPSADLEMLVNVVADCELVKLQQDNQNISQNVIQENSSGLADKSQNLETIAALDAAYVTRMAEVLHTSYQKFHEMMHVTEIVKYKDAIEAKQKKRGTADELTQETSDLIQNQGDGFNLLSAFDQLPEKWRKVNKDSARHILMIVQSLYPQYINGITAEEKNTVLNDEQLLFQINSLLYNQWAEKNRRSANQSINPLFCLSSYEDFKIIADEESSLSPEQKKALLGSYKEYLKQNLEGINASLQEALNTLKDEDKQKVQKLLQTNVIDSNNNEVIEKQEIDAMEDALLLRTITAQARFELQKDKQMMQNFLANLG